MAIRTFIEIASLCDIKQNRREIESKFFNKSEKTALLRVQTLAGFLCVKKAVVAALRENDERRLMIEKDVLVSHDAQGGPVILHMPQKIQKKIKKICVSVSHTKDYACGSAVLQKDQGNG